MTDHPSLNPNKIKFYAAIGHLCQQWIAVEYLYSRLASEMIGLKREKHDLLFRHLGIVAISDFLRDYAEAQKKPGSTREQIAHVTKYVNQCRINRNAIVHGSATVESMDSIRMQSPADKNRASKREFAVSLEDIRRVSDECETAGILSVRLQILISRKNLKTLKGIFGTEWRSILHAKPALPKLVAVSPQTHPKPQLLQKSSLK